MTDQEAADLRREVEELRAGLNHLHVAKTAMQLAFNLLISATQEKSPAVFSEFMSTFDRETTFRKEAGQADIAEELRNIVLDE